MKAKKTISQESINQLREGNRNVSDRVCNRLREMIIRGDIAPGTAFPIETEFCEQLGVGRSSLRETYKVLESEGYIRRTNRGTFVNPPEKILETRPFSTTIKRSEFKDLMEFRMIIECGIAELAARRANPEVIAELQGYLDRMRENTEDLMELTKYDFLFHKALAKASGNKLLQETMQMASPTLREGTYEAFQIDTKANVDQALCYHEHILEAIRNHDEAMAKELMRNHILAIKQRSGEY